MELATNIYRKAAMLLWGGVSLVIGVSIGFYFEMGEKKTLFIVVVAVGLYVLALMRWSKKKEDKESQVESGSNDTSSKQQGEDQSVSLGEEDEHESGSVKEEENHKSVKEVDVGGKKLSDQESREWIDDLLVKQQKD